MSSHPLSNSPSSNGKDKQHEDEHDKIMDSSVEEKSLSDGGMHAEAEEKEQNPFESGSAMTSLSSDTFQFPNQEEESKSSPLANGHSNSTEKNPLFSEDAACEVTDFDDIHRTVAMQFDADELERAVDSERIKDEVEERGRRADGSTTHIGEVTIRRRDNRFLNVKIMKPKKKLHILFGAKLTCEVYDEVRLAVWVLAFLAAATVVILFVVNLSTNFTDFLTPSFDLEHAVAMGVAAPFVVMATLMSFFQIRKHSQNWVHPPSQKCVVRILAMVPIYAISAWLALWLLKVALYIDFIRQCYEAFVIYQFMVLLTQYLGGSSGVVESIQYKPPIKWPAPLCYCSHVLPGATFLRWLKYGALQYTILTPMCAILAIISDKLGIYDNGTWSPSDVYSYVTFIVNCSQMTSLYCLVWLYVVLKNELAPFNPMYKFLVVKSVVFFTWWQGVGIAFMADLGWINSDPSFQSGLQDFIVCIEMFIAAAAHRYTFGYETYANGSMTLLMEQRAQRLAELNYKQAVEEQQKRMKELGILDITAAKLTGGKIVTQKEDQEDGPALFDDDQPIPENVIAPVILQAMKAQEKEQEQQQRLLQNQDSEMTEMTSSTNGHERMHNVEDGTNPFERV